MLLQNLSFLIIFEEYLHAKFNFCKKMFAKFKLFAVIASTWHLNTVRKISSRNMMTRMSLYIRNANFTLMYMLSKASIMYRLSVVASAK